MKKIFVLFILFVTIIFAQEENLDAKITNLAKTILQKYPDKTTVYLGIYKFQTEDGKENNLCKYLAEELYNKYLDSKRFKMVERAILLQEFQKNKFDFSKMNNQQLLEKISQNIFQTTNYVPEAYLFGTMKDYDDVIKLSIKIISVSTGNTILNMSYDLAADEQTDKLLGKPIRKKQKKVDTVIVVKEKVVPVEKVVVKEVVVEKPVYKETPTQSQTQEPQTGNFFPKQVTIDNITFTFLDCYWEGGKVQINFSVINNDPEKDLEIKVDKSHFFSNNGNEYKDIYVELGTNQSWNYIKKIMPSKVMFKGKITIDNVKSNETSMQLFEMIINDKKITLRDVPILRKE